MPAFDLKHFLHRNRLSLGQLHIFTVHLHLMFRSGINLHEALSILSNQIDEIPALSARYLAQDLEKGLSFSVALKKQSASFPEAYVRVIEAGEESGLLEQSLARLAENLEKQSSVRQSLKGALIYPTFLLAGCGTLVCAMLYLIFPMVLSVTGDAGVEPPALTRMIMELTRPAVGVTLAVSAILSGMLFYTLWRSNRWGPPIRKLVEGYTPPGRFFVNMGILESTRQLSMLISSGVDIVRSLTFAARAAGGSVLLSEAYEKIVQDVRLGADLSTSYAEFPFFPPMLVSMLAVSEEAGNASTALNHFCLCLEEDLDLKLRHFTTLLEPMLLAGMGGIVGVLLVAAFMPIYNLILL